MSELPAILVLFAVPVALYVVPALIVRRLIEPDRRWSSDAPSGNTISSPVRLINLAVFLALSSPLLSQAPARSLEVNFTASADSFRAATEEYREIWVKEGSRIVEAMERVSGLRFEPGPIEVSVYEGTSYSGERGGRPMLLRASYPTETKRGTLVHELAHRLAADVPFKGEHHDLIFLFVYDVWVDLWGQRFADDQVRIESLRKGVDYEGIWKKTLAQPAAERARRLRSLVVGR